VFGSRDLFEQLKKKHLTGKRREKLRQEWEERRYGFLYSRGDKSKEGNLNLRLVNLNNQWYLRINLENGEYVWAKVVRSAKREKDKWIDLVWDLTQAERTGNWFAYTVRLKLKNGKIYAQISREENLPEITIQTATPTPATPRKMERLRSPTKVGQKSWRVLSVALSFSLP
jgi:hypothetical protein